MMKYRIRDLREDKDLPQKDIAKLLNTTQKVLLTEISEKDNNKLCGYTETMKLVNVTCDKNLIGTIQDVIITDAKSFSLDGIIK